MIAGIIVHIDPIGEGFALQEDRMGKVGQQREKTPRQNVEEIGNLKVSKTNPKEYRIEHT